MPDFQFQEMFPSGKDATPYRKLSSDFVGTTKFNGRDVLTIEPEALTSASLFAVSATMSIRCCSFSCRSGIFTLSVTR